MTERRERLLDRRAAETFEIEHAGVAHTVSFGYYDDGRPGEVFVNTRKAGTPVDTAARDIAVLVSLLLQYGCSPKIMGRALTKDHAGAIAGLLERENG